MERKKGRKEKRGGRQAGKLPEHYSHLLILISGDLGNIIGCLLGTKKRQSSRMWWYMPVIPRFRR